MMACDVSPVAMFPTYIVLSLPLPLQTSLYQRSLFEAVFMSISKVSPTDGQG